MKNNANKAVLKAIREKTEDRLPELKNHPNGMFILVRGLKIERFKEEDV